MGGSSVVSTLGMGRRRSSRCVPLCPINDVALIICVASRGYLEPRRQERAALYHLVTWYVFFVPDYCFVPDPCRFADAQGAKVADLELISTAALSSSKEQIKGIVKSPAYAELRK